jgi:hypothetical protein
MTSINRAALIVRPLEPYRAWARGLEENSPIDEADDLTSVYLVDLPDDGEPQQVIRAQFARIFDEQLASWMRDTRTWPKRRTYDMFRQWFSVQVADIVYDLGADPDDLVEDF